MLVLLAVAGLQLRQLILKKPLGESSPSPRYAGVADAFAICEERGLIGELVCDLRVTHRIPVLARRLQAHQSVNEFSQIALSFGCQARLLGDISGCIQVDAASSNARTGPAIGRQTEPQRYFAAPNVPDGLARCNPQGQANGLAVAPLRDFPGDPFALAVGNRALDIVVDQSA